MVIDIFTSIVMILTAAASAVTIAAIVIAFFGPFSVNKRECVCLGSLALVIAIISIIYHNFEYYSALVEVYSCGPVLRVSDTWLITIMQLLWVVLLIESILRSEKTKISRIVRIIYPIIFIIDLIVYGFLIDQNYNIINSQNRMIVVLMIATCFLLYIAMLVWCLILLLRDKTQDYVFGVIGCLILIADNLLCGFQAIRLVLDITQLDTYYTSPFNLLPIVRIIFSLLILAYSFYRFFAKASKMTESKDQSIVTVAAQYGFTDREREVAELIIEGFTYTEIAEKLFISTNTVKHHINSIYKKTNCTSKSKFIKLVLDRPDDR